MKSVDCIDDLKIVQPILYNIIKNSLDFKKISHAYLIEVPTSYNKIEIGLALSKSIICSYNRTDSCNNCNICKMIKEKEYPDIEIIEPDKLNIKKDIMENLKKKFSTKSLQNSKKIYIINGAEYLNLSSANDILKFLEEPKSDIYAILLVSNIYQVIDTIKSRCQIIQFTSDTKEKFSNSENDDLDFIISFAKRLEKDRINIIPFMNKMWYDKFNSKEDIDKALSNLIYIYKCIIDRKLQVKVTNTIDISELAKITENISVLEFCRRIQIIINTKNRNLSNANVKLNIDKMIIDMV